MSRPLHKQSRFFVKKGLFNNVYSFKELEKRIEKLKAKNIKAENLLRGDAFEVFVEAFLNTHDSYEAVKVYPSLAQTPAIIRQELKVGKKDKGIDGIFLTKDDKIIPYQAKFRTGREVVDYADITKFLQQSKITDIRYLIGNSNDVNDEYKKDKKTNLSVKGYDFDNLSKDQFQTAINWLKQKPPLFKPTKPDPKYQTKIIADTCKELRKTDRATMLMACASGKTLVSMWIAQKIAPKNIVIFVPSLALIKQFHDEWISEKPFKNILKKVICSKLGEQQDYDDEKLTQDDVTFEVTTKPLKVRKFLNLNFNGTKIIYCTYQSSRVLKEAMQSKHVIDFGIFDEAHRTTQYKNIIRKKKNKNPEINWSLGLFDKHIKINKRLFMTATTKEIKTNQFLKDGDDKIIYAMNDVSIYGKKVCNFTFSQAREVGAICPYEILISVITKKDLSVYTIKKSNVLIDGEEISAEQFALQLAVKAAVKKFKPKKIFTFHHRCSSANSFVKKGNPEGIQRHLKDFFTGYVDGAMSMGDRTDIMSLFQSYEKSLVSNARCLVEGVNIPAVDMVVFVDPKKSKTDIAQAAGRAMRIRNLPNKKIGYVLIPLFLESFKGEKVKEASARSGFDEVISTLRGLAEFDDDIRDEMTLLKVNQLRGKGLNKIGRKLKTLSGKSKDRNIQIIGNSESLELAIEAEVLNRYKKDATWESYLAMLIEWKEKHKNFEIPLETKKPFLGLGEWVHGVRLRHRNGDLNELRVKQLNSMGFRWCFDGETLDNVGGLILEKTFEKTSKLPWASYRRKNIVKPEGFYYTNQLSAFYRPEQLEEFQKAHGITVLDTKNLLNPPQFIKKCGINIRIYKEGLKSGDLVPFGYGISVGKGKKQVVGSSPYFKEKQVERFAKKLGIRITDLEGYFSAQQLINYSDASGNLRLGSAKEYIDKGYIKSAGKAYLGQKIQDVYKLPDPKELRIKLGITLANVKGLLSNEDLSKQIDLKTSASRFIKPKGTYWSNYGKGNVVSRYYDPDEVRLYYKRRKITLRDTKNLIPEAEIAKIMGIKGRSGITLRPLIDKGVISFEGYGLFKTKRHRYYKKTIIKDIEKFYGAPFLKNTKGMLRQADVAKMKGMSGIPRLFQQELIKCVGVKADGKLISRYFKKKDVEKLQKARAKLKGNSTNLGIVTISDTKGLISEIEIEKIMGLKTRGAVLPPLIKKGVISDEGTGLYKNKVRRYYKKSVIKTLEKHYGGPFLKNTNGMLSQPEVAKMKGMVRISQYFQEGLIKCAGIRAGKKRVVRYFKKKDVEQLHKARAKLKPNQFTKI